MMMSREVTEKLLIIGAALLMVFSGVAITAWSPLVGLVIMIAGYFFLIGFVSWLSVGTRQTVVIFAVAFLAPLTGKMLWEAIFSDEGFTYFWFLPSLCLLAILLNEVRHKRTSGEMGSPRKG